MPYFFRMSGYPIRTQQSEARSSWTCSGRAFMLICESEDLLTRSGYVACETQKLLSFKRVMLLDWYRAHEEIGVAQCFWQQLEYHLQAISPSCCHRHWFRTDASWLDFLCGTRPSSILSVSLIAKEGERHLRGLTIYRHFHFSYRRSREFLLSRTSFPPVHR